MSFQLSPTGAKSTTFPEQQKLVKMHFVQFLILSTFETRDKRQTDYVFDILVAKNTFGLIAFENVFLPLTHERHKI